MMAATTSDRVGDDDEAFAEAMRGARPLGLRDARVTAPQPAIAEPRRKRQATATPAGGVRRRADGRRDRGARRGRVAQVVARAARRRARRRCAAGRARARARGGAACAGKLRRGWTRAWRPHLAGDPRARPRVRRGRAGVAARRSGNGSRAPPPNVAASWRSSSARPRDGGAGATMILLRRPEPLHGRFARAGTAACWAGAR